MIAPHRRPVRRAHKNRVHYRTNHELILVGNSVMRQALIDKAPVPKYNLRLSQDIPKNELYDRAVRLLKCTAEVDKSELSRFLSRTEALDRNSNLTMFEILCLIGLD